MQKETHNLNSGLYNIDMSCPFLCYISFQAGGVIMRTRMVFEYGSPTHRWKVSGDILALSERCKGKYIVVSPEQ